MPDTTHGDSAPPTQAIAEELLDLVVGLVPCERAYLCVYHPTARAHRLIASMGPVADGTAWLAELDAAAAAETGAAPLRWTADAVTLRVVSADGRYTGSLRLYGSFADRRERVTEQLLRILPLVGALIDAMHLPGQLPTDVSPHARGVVLLDDGTTVALPDRTAGEHLSERAALLAEIRAASGRGELPERFHWRDDRGHWHAVQCRRSEIGIVVTEDDATLPFGLTARELDVLTLIARGYTNPQIASRLVVSDRTVAKHVEHLLSKIGATSRTAAAAIAVRTGLIELATGAGH